MTAGEVLDIGAEAIWVMLGMAAPVMLIGLAVGVLIALFQALTQVQEMTLVFVPKIIVIFLALLIFLPRSTVTAAVVHSMFYPALFGMIYVAGLCAAIFFGHSASGAGMSDIGGVMALFDHPNGIIIGWTHYLVFDLFVGAWIGRDAIRHAIPHYLVIPCLMGAFIFGPVGLLLYLLLRLMLRKKLLLQE